MLMWLAYYPINLSFELVEQSNCILDKWFYTFWRELKCVSMAEIVAESGVLLMLLTSRSDIMFFSAAASKRSLCHDSP